MNKVIRYAKDYFGENELYEEWDLQKGRCITDKPTFV